MNNKILVGSIGGGSGNDSLAVSLFLRQNKNIKNDIKVQILDYSYSAWKKSNSEILEKTYKSQNLNFSWNFADFKGDEGSFCGNFKINYKMDKI